jgi:DnaJ-class molecular chaperone
MTRQHAEKLLRPFGLDKDGPEKAFRRAAMRYHPDKGGSAVAFRRLCDAREALKTTDKQWDETFGARPEPFGFGPGFEEHIEIYHRIFRPDDMMEQMNKILEAWRVMNEKK